MTVMRDFYQNSPFDLTAGVAAGPFGNPNRYSGVQHRPGEPDVKGSWERPISLYRTDYSVIHEIDGSLPPSVGARLWFGPVAAHSTFYVPHLGGQLSMHEALTRGHKGGPIDRKSGMWAARYLQQIVNLRFDAMMGDVREMQSKWHEKSLEALSSAVKNADNMTEATAIMSTLTSDVVDAWWSAIDYLIFKYADGNVYGAPSECAAGTATAIGYPDWWLKDVGYPNGPPVIPPEDV